MKKGDSLDLAYGELLKLATLANGNSFANIVAQDIAITQLARMIRKTTVEDFARAKALIAKATIAGATHEYES